MNGNISKVEEITYKSSFLRRQESRELFLSPQFIEKLQKKRVIFFDLLVSCESRANSLHAPTQCLKLKR